MGRQDITLQEVKNEALDVAIFTYTGHGNPRTNLDEAITDYVQGRQFYSFVSSTLDNPWVRVVIIGDL